MKISDTLITEIADNLQMDSICFYHKTTGELDHYPNNIDEFGEEEHPWLEIIEKTEQNPDDYIKIAPMRSNESFRIMEKFVAKLDNTNLQNELSNALSRSKSFSNFKSIVDNSGEYRQLWFDHLLEENKIWVKQCFDFGNNTD